MSESLELKKALHKRLLPLYIAAFFQGFVLWYTIEKLFMQSIGFNNATIGIMVAAYSVAMLIFDTPSGILADRWSRKGVLILASLCLSLSGLIGGLSHGVGQYLFSSIFWGIFFACYSGMYDSIIYDTIAETTGHKQGLVEHLFGRIQVMDGAALVLSSLIGGVIASQVSLRYTYYLSVPIAFVSIIALLKFKEPRLHKARVALPIKQQIKDSLKAILKNRGLLPVLTVLIIRSTLGYIVFEFSQLWLLALHTPTAWYGLANATLLGSIGVGGILAARAHFSRNVVMFVNLVLIIAGFITLIVSRNILIIVPAQFIVSTGLIGIDVVFRRILHDNLGSAIRAGAASAANTLGRFLIVPLSLLFGYISNIATVYHAAYILLAFGLAMAIFVVQVAGMNGRTGLRTIR